MKSKIKRLSLAAVLSGTGFAATFLWYKSTDSSRSQSGEKPLAQVGSVSDEVLRRPPTRLLWNAVNTGDPLFNGEAIRTSEAGEVRIQFEDGRYIDIEPDSLIVLSKAQGEISLDLMEGSLFVNAKAEAGGAPAAGLVLNSAQGKVDLTGASASLSKSEGQKLNLQVVEGSAKIQSKDGQTKELTSGKTGVLGFNGLQFDANQIKILSPLPNKSVYIDPEKKPEINFNWTGFPKEWKVSIMAGTQRRQLKEIQSVAPGLEKTVSTLPLGRHYWKIVAHDPKTHAVLAETPVYRLDVTARSTPSLLAPAPNASIELEKLPGSVLFQWQKPEEASQLVLEVAMDNQLKQKVVTQRVDGMERLDLPNLKEGTYYWRLNSYYPDVKTPWSGPIQQFKVSKKAETKALQVQVNFDSVSTQQFFAEEPALSLAWTAGSQTEQVAQWKVNWKDMADPNSELKTIETADVKLNTKVPKPGRYMASVEAFDIKGRSMGKSSNIQVSVESRPLLPAPKLLPLDGQLTSQSNGRGEISWTEVQGAKHYKLVVLAQDGKEVLSKNYDTNKTTLSSMMPGEYTLSIQAVDEFGRNSAETTKRSYIVPDKSNLRAPALRKVKVN